MTKIRGMRLSMYLDVGIIKEIQRLAQQYHTTSSQVARALIRAGIRVINEGGIKIRGGLLGFERPFIEVRFKGLTGNKKRFGVRLGSVADEVNNVIRPGETVSGCAISLLHLGLIAHEPESFELTGPTGLRRRLAEPEVPEVDTEAILREEQN